MRCREVTGILCFTVCNFVSNCKFLIFALCQNPITCTNSASRYCDHSISLLVGWFLRLFLTLVVSTSPIFMRFVRDVQHMRQISLLTVERSRSKFKVITAILKYLQIVIARPLFKYIHQIWQSDSYWNTRTYNFCNVTFDKMTAIWRKRFALRA